MRYACTMKRTTVMLSDDVSARLKHEARRRRVPVAEIVREAVEQHLSSAVRKRLSIIGIAEGGPPDASERVDEHVLAALRRYRGT